MQLHEGCLLQGGKYRIKNMLGQGGFGITYLAEWIDMNTQVVVKEFYINELCTRKPGTLEMTVLSEGGRKTVDHFRKKFLREAKTILALKKHPNIINLLDFFSENGTAYYVMDYLCGGSLSLKVKRHGVLPVEDALRYVRQVASALAFVHERKQMHLDVKPGNIMLDDDDNAILIDFGLVKVYDDDGSSSSTISSTMHGYSPGYAPAEQIMATKDTIFTPATDIYALGATLFNLLEGQTPPHAQDVRKLKGNFPFIHTTAPWLQQAIVKAMAPEEEDRPQTIAEFLQLLEGEVPVEEPVNVKVEEVGKEKEQKEDGHDTDEETKLDYAVALSRALILYNMKDYKAALPCLEKMLHDYPEQRAAIVWYVDRCKEALTPPPSPEPVTPPVSPTSSTSRKKNSWLGYAVVAVIACLLGFFGVKLVGGEKNQTVSTDKSSTEVTVDADALAYVSALSRGKLLYNRGDYSGALSCFEEMLTAYPSHRTDINSWIAKCQTALENASYAESLKKGEGYYNNKQYDQAISHFKSMLDSYPTHRSDINAKIAKCEKAKENALAVSKSNAVAKSSSSSSSSSGSYNDHSYVDLGLSVKWATCNVGASSPEDYGSYFAWGEVSTKSEYTSDNSKTYGNSNFGSIAGNASYDAARSNWGSPWRLPTKSELDELKNKCRWSWTSQGGKKGYKVTGPNGNSIFLPAAGYRDGTSLSSAGSYGYYWSATPNESYSYYAYSLNFNSSGQLVDWSYRYYGRSVRPVAE